MGNLPAGFIGVEHDPVVLKKRHRLEGLRINRWGPILVVHDLREEAPEVFGVPVRVIDGRRLGLNGYRAMVREPGRALLCGERRNSCCDYEESKHDATDDSARHFVTLLCETCVTHLHFAHVQALPAIAERLRETLQLSVPRFRTNRTGSGSAVSVELRRTPSKQALESPRHDGP